MNFVIGISRSRLKPDIDRLKWIYFSMNFEKCLCQYYDIHMRKQMNMQGWHNYESIYYILIGHIQHKNLEA